MVGKIRLEEIMNIFGNFQGEMENGGQQNFFCLKFTVCNELGAKTKIKGQKLH